MIIAKAKEMIVADFEKLNDLITDSGIKQKLKNTTV